MASTKRQAFTLVELLVVIAIIGMLMALLLPAVNQAIGSARRAQCENNQRQIGQALQLYESSKGRFPGFVNTISTRPAIPPTPVPIVEQSVSWVVAILPELQRRDLYDIWSSNTLKTDIPLIPIDLMVCPADPQLTLGGEWLSYVVNCGQPGDNRPGPPATPRSDGIFFDRTISNPLEMKLDYVAANDGTMTTLMLTENMGADLWRGSSQQPTFLALEYQLGFLWMDNDTAPFPPNAATRVINRVLPGTFMIPNVPYQPPMAETIFPWARPSSGHAGGVVATFVDGHTIFLSENVDRDIYKLMCSPNGVGTAPQQMGILRESDFTK